MSTTTLTQDARNRALRTFLQGLAIDLVVAVAGLILTNVDKITDRAALIAFGITVAKTVLTTAASFVMRRFLDRSSLPTPLPPSPVPEPNDDEPPVAEVTRLRRRIPVEDVPHEQVPSEGTAPDGYGSGV